MKIFAKLLTSFLLSLLGVSTVFAQDDEARQQSGLPSYIGNRPGTNTTPGSDARISGTVEIQGITDQNKAPALTVAVLANGVLVARQRVQNKGGFSFTGVPRHGVTLIVEANNQEIGSFPMGTLTPPPMSNRKDIILLWNRDIPNKTGVISLRDSYERTAENQRAFEKAMAGSGEKNKGNALKMLEQVVEKDANDYVAWTELGNLSFMDEKYSEAEKAYDKAITLKADFLPALVNLGKLHLSQKKFEPSIEILGKALELAPQSADVNQYLGEAYLQAKKGSKAVILLNKAIELAPVEKAEVHLRLASLYHGAGAKDRAAAEYTMFLEKVPNHSEKAKFEKYISENTPK